MGITGSRSTALPDLYKSTEINVGLLCEDNSRRDTPSLKKELGLIEKYLLLDLFPLGAGIRYETINIQNADINVGDMYELGFQRWGENLSEHCDKFHVLIALACPFSPESPSFVADLIEVCCLLKDGGLFVLFAKYPSIEDVIVRAIQGVRGKQCHGSLQLQYNTFIDLSEAEPNMKNRMIIYTKTGI
jgi:hypothetical protein